MSAVEEFADVLPGLSKRCERLREVSMALQGEILGELEPSMAWQAVEMLGIAPGREAVAGVGVGALVVPEFSMYGVFADGENAVQRFRRTHPQTDPERQMVLDAMSQAIFTLIGVVEAYPAEDAVVVEDLFQNNQRILLTDSAFTADSPAGEVNCIRMYPMGKFWMCTGLELPIGVDTKHPPLLNYLASDLTRIVQKATSGDETRNGLYAAVVIKTLLAHHYKDSGVSGKIVNEQSDEQAEEHPNEPLLSERIERNGPCPCGSGKKYKKCCGH